MATSAPSAAKPRAMALPMPRLPPVTSATRPSSVMVGDSSRRAVDETLSAVAADRRHQARRGPELRLLDVGSGAQRSGALGDVLAPAQSRHDDDRGLGGYPADERQR